MLEPTARERNANRYVARATYNKQELNRKGPENGLVRSHQWRPPLRQFLMYNRAAREQWLRPRKSWRRPRARAGWA